MRPVPPAKVRRAGRDDVPRLVEVLARAFDDDPIPNYLFRGERRRRRGLRRFFSIQLRQIYLGAGEVWTTTDVRGAAAWVPPSMSRPGVRELVHLLPVLSDLAGLGRRARPAIRLLLDVARARPVQEHWYLGVLGTDPEHQGRGVGSALLGEVLERLDRDGVPAYLESSKERNLAFYARHGFEETGAIHAAGDGPTVWLMWREPRT